MSSSLFSEMDWNSVSYYLAIDLGMDGNWVPIGAQKLATLPTAFHSRVTENINGALVPLFNSNLEAINAGLTIGQCYRTADGTIMIVIQD